MFGELIIRAPSEGSLPEKADWLYSEYNKYVFFDSAYDSSTLKQQFRP